MSPHHGSHFVGDGCLPDGHRSDPTLADLRVGDGSGSPVVGRLWRLLEAATPGPWGWFDAFEMADGRVGADRLGSLGSVDADVVSPVNERTVAVSRDDAQFIVEVRNRLPALLEIAEAARDVMTHDALPEPEALRRAEALVAALARLEETA